MITEDYVGFETAKLLKEKGFDWECEKAYISSEAWSEANYEPPYTNKSFNEYFEKDCCTKPTLQMAMKWLREVYGLFTRITEDMTGNVFEWSVYQKNYGCKASTYVEESYEQACEVAIKYCLEHLI